MYFSAKLGKVVAANTPANVFDKVFHSKMDGRMSSVILLALSLRSKVSTVIDIL